MRSWITCAKFDKCNELRDRLVKWIPKRHFGKVNIKDNIVYLKNPDSVVCFKSEESGIDTFTSEKLGWASVDEPLKSEKIYAEIISRLVDLDGYFWMTMTPVETRAWLKNVSVNNAENDEDVEIFNATIYDNPLLTERAIKRWEDDLRRAGLSEDEISTRKYGDFGVGEEKVYPEFNDSHLVDHYIPPEHWTLFRAVDPGLGNPCACVWGAVKENGDVYVFKEYLRSRLSIGNNVVNILDMSYDMDVMDTFLDPAMGVQGQMSSGEKIIEHFRQAGLDCQLAPRGKVKERIGRVKEYLRVPGKLTISKQGCPLLIKFLKDYYYDTPKGDKVVNENPNHAGSDLPDALGYLLTGRPYYYDRNRIRQIYKPKNPITGI